MSEFRSDFEGFRQNNPRRLTLIQQIITPSQRADNSFLFAAISRLLKIDLPAYIIRDKDVDFREDGAFPHRLTTNLQVDKGRVLLEIALAPANCLLA